MSETVAIRPYTGKPQVYFVDEEGDYWFLFDDQWVHESNTDWLYGVEQENLHDEY